MYRGQYSKLSSNFFKDAGRFRAKANTVSIDYAVAHYLLLHRNDQSNLE